MTAQEFRAIREALLLTPEQLAPLLGYAPKRQTIAQLELTTESARTIPPPVVLLMRAYASGYRPKDWPAKPGLVPVMKLVRAD